MAQLLMLVNVPTNAITPLGRFRIVAFWEGISFLLLLLVAMPLKYLFGLPAAVSVIGMAHGVLFLVYIAALALAAPRLGVTRVVLALVVSLIPGGTFWLESRLRKDELKP